MALEQRVRSAKAEATVARAQRLGEALVRYKERNGDRLPAAIGDLVPTAALAHIGYAEAIVAVKTGSVSTTLSSIWRRQVACPTQSTESLASFRSGFDILRGTFSGVRVIVDRLRAAIDPMAHPDATRATDAASRPPAARDTKVFVRTAMSEVPEVEGEHGGDRRVRRGR